jgi:hypothetical protein
MKVKTNVKAGLFDDIGVGVIGAGAGGAFSDAVVVVGG